MLKNSRLWLLSVFFSTLLHLFLLFLSAHRLKKHPEHEYVKPIELTTMDMLIGKQHGEGRKKKRGHISLKQLQPRYSDFPMRKDESVLSTETAGKTGIEGGGRAGSDYGDGDGLTGGWITSVGMDTYLPVMQYTQEVWDRIDANLNYPQEFANFRISGKVNIRLVLNPDGTMSGAFQKVQSDHNMLEAYVLTLLLSILDNPFITEKNRPKTKIAFNLAFDFQTETEYVFMGRDKGNSLPHTLIFKRVVIVPTVLEKALDNFLTNYFPPILIIGPMVYIDVFRAYQFVQNIGKPSTRELEQQRLEYLTTKLKLALKKSSIKK